MVTTHDFVEVPYLHLHQFRRCNNKKKQNCCLSLLFKVFLCMRSFNPRTFKALNQRTLKALNQRTLKDLNQCTSKALNPRTLKALNPRTSKALNPRTFKAEECAPMLKSAHPSRGAG